MWEPPHRACAISYYPIVYANRHHLVQGMADLNVRSHRMSLLVNLHTKKAHSARGPTS